MGIDYRPHQYQRQAIDWLIQKTAVEGEPGAGLFLDPGLGKTTITLSWFEFMRAMGSSAVLVVAPLRVIYSVWPREISKWNQFQHLKTSIIHGSPTKKLAAFAEPADVYLINPEGIPWLQTTYQKRDLPFDTLVVDESSKFKNWSAKRTKALRKLLPRLSPRLILTGTPSPNGLQDLFAQTFICDRGERFGKSIGQFRQRYFYQGGFGGYKWLPIEGSDTLIHDRISDICLRMSAEEYLDLPDRIENDVEILLPPAAMKHYQQLEREMFLELDSADITPLNAGAKYNLCRQAVSGAVYDQDDKTVHHDVHKAKADAVIDIVDELGGKPVLIAFGFRHELANLRKRLPGLPSIDGRTKADEADRLIEQWNAGELPYLAVQPKSLSHGVNMQAGPGRDIIWTTLSDSLEDYQQLNARLHRQGVTGQVRIHRLIATDTVDEAVLKRIESKDKSQSALLQALREYREKRQ